MVAPALKSSWQLDRQGGWVRQMAVVAHRVVAKCTDQAIASACRSLSHFPYWL